MKKVNVYEINSYDGIAARSLDEAKTWYAECTGQDAAALDVKEVDVNQSMRLPKTSIIKTLKEMIADRWEGQPIVLYTGDYR